MISDDYENRKAALDALTFGLRALKAQIAEARSSVTLTPAAVRRLKDRLERWRLAHSALSCEQGAERTQRMDARDDVATSAEHLIPSTPPSPTGGPMLSREATAIALLKSAISWEPEARLIGNLRACELAALAASIVTCCPKCGAEPWVDIDCDLCLVATALTAGEVP